MMNPPRNATRVRCPAPGCGREFDVSQDWLGRNMYCPACGVRMTAKPTTVEERLLRRQRSVSGGPGANLRRLPLVALLDNLRSLWNVGSIFRTADACGFRELVLSGITGSPPRPEISKTALGADEAVAWSYHADAFQAFERLTAEGYRPVVVETSERAVPLDEMRWPEKVCLVVGNEVAGVTPRVLEACPDQVCIPMHGVKNSLNVAVAFGIAAYRAAAALRAAERDRDGCRR